MLLLASLPRPNEEEAQLLRLRQGLHSTCHRLFTSSQSCSLGSHARSAGFGAGHLASLKTERCSKAPDVGSLIQTVYLQSSGQAMVFTRPPQGSL